MAAVLASRLSIVEFARWVMSNSWNMQADSPAIAVSLASEIHALLSERDDYSLSDSAFLRELQALYGNSVVSVSIDIDEFTSKKATQLSTHSVTETVTYDDATVGTVSSSSSPLILAPAPLVA